SAEARPDEVRRHARRGSTGRRRARLAAGVDRVRTLADPIARLVHAARAVAVDTAESAADLPAQPAIVAAGQRLARVQVLEVDPRRLCVVAAPAQHDVVEREEADRADEGLGEELIRSMSSN